MTVKANYTFALDSNLHTHVQHKFSLFSKYHTVSIGIFRFLNIIHSNNNNNNYLRLIVILHDYSIF